MERNRGESERKLLEAVSTILLKEGFDRLKVNQIAQTAGLNKVLIYRYFGGFDGLLAAWIEQQDIFSITQTQITEILQQEETLVGAGSEILCCFAEGLRKNPLLQEVMRWELSTRNELTRQIAEKREQTSQQLNRQLAERYRIPDNIDLAAVSSILNSGLTYLVLRSHTIDVYASIPLNEDEGFKRLYQSIKTILEALLP